MHKPTEDREALSKSELASPPSHPGREAWVTPLVREYDPAAVTKTYGGPSGSTDSSIYS